MIHSICVRNLTTLASAIQEIGKAIQNVENGVAWRVNQGWNFAEIFGVEKIWAIVRRCLHDPTFSRFGTIPVCNGQMDGHRMTAYRLLR